MAADTEMVSSDAPKTDATKDKATEAAPPSVQADIQHNLTLVRSAVSILEPRLVTKVLRTLGSIRKRLDAAALKEVIEAAFPPSKSVSDSDLCDALPKTRLIWTCDHIHR